MNLKKIYFFIKKKFDFFLSSSIKRKSKIKKIYSNFCYVLNLNKAFFKSQTDIIIKKMILHYYLQ